MFMSPPELVPLGLLMFVKVIDIVEVIRKIEAFRGLEPDQAANLLKLFRPQTVKRDEQILKAGDLSREMFVLLRGKLKVTTEGGEKLGEILPGLSVGEMGAITGRPSVCQCHGYARVGDPDRKCGRPEDVF